MTQLVAYFAFISTFAVIVAATAADEAPSDQPQPGEQGAQTFQREVPVKLPYLLYLPKDYEQQKVWPLLLFLHGAGERGDDLQLVKVHGPPKLIANGSDFPMIVVSPQCPADKWWQAAHLSALLDQIEQDYKVDQERIYLTGLSMGGFGTWALAAYEPHRFAAIVPICGGGDGFRTRFYPQLPVWAFHGADDDVVPLVNSQLMVDAQKQHGGQPKLTVYPDAGHDSWTATYDNAEVYEWLLSQRRQETAAGSKSPAPPRR